MSMLGNYFKVALHNLLRHKVYSAINIFGLAVGLAACIVILALGALPPVVRQFHRDAEPVSASCSSTRASPGVNSREYRLHHAADGSGSQDGITPRYRIIAGSRKSPSTWWCGTVTRVLPRIMLCLPIPLPGDVRFPPGVGRSTGALEDPNSVVFTDVFARKIFGDEDPVGKTLDVCYKDLRLSFQVAAVVERPPANSSLQFDLLAPLGLREKSSPGWLTRWGMNEPYHLPVIVSGADRAALEKKIDRELLARYSPQSDKNIRLFMVPLKRYICALRFPAARP